MTPKVYILRKPYIYMAPKITEDNWAYIIAEEERQLIIVQLMREGKERKRRVNAAIDWMRRVNGQPWIARIVLTEDKAWYGRYS